MPMMSAAADAVVLRARIDQVIVLLHVEDPRDRSEEARPAGARFELHRGGEERQAAARAGEDAGALLVIEGAGAGALGAFLAHDVEGLGGQALLPLILRELHRLAWRRHVGAGWQEGFPVLLQLVYAFHG